MLIDSLQTWMSLGADFPPKPPERNAAQQIHWFQPSETLKRKLAMPTQNPDLQNWGKS